MGTPFANEQFPVEAFDEFGKQVITDLNAGLDEENPTWTNLSGLAIKLHGAVVMGHSESGFFPERTALVNPANLEGLITIETECLTTLTPAQISTLAGIPILMVFGDHLGDVPGHEEMWPARFKTCQQVVDQVNAAGGDATMMQLPTYWQLRKDHTPIQNKNNRPV